ncbi:MAG: redoxin domain-containing protein [SAR202 cluster bacterium]|nr:redoxin domain-containing protein [SAR202 cluster bacterium]
MTTTRKIIEAGDLAPDFTLPDTDGAPVSLSSYRGKKLAIFVWGSWCGCRNQLPAWQELYNQHAGQGLEVLGVSMDSEGPFRVTPFITWAKTTFKTVVDVRNTLTELYGLKAVPTCYLVDESGVVRFKQHKGFDIRKAESAAVIERWLAGRPPIAEGLPPSAPVGKEVYDGHAVYLKGLEAFRAGRREEAIAIWRDGLAKDPDNFILMKQAWSAENPDAFKAALEKLTEQPAPTSQSSIP